MIGFVRCQTSTSTYSRVVGIGALRRHRDFLAVSTTEKWLKPWKVTIVADDKTGLSYEQIQHVLKHCRYFRFLIVEIAVDFPPSAGIDTHFVRQHGVFGKSRRYAKRDNKRSAPYGSRKTGQIRPLLSKRRN